MALKWIDIKNYLTNASDEVLKTSVRCLEHHHGRLLTCYPIVRRTQEIDLLCLVLDMPCNFKETLYCTEELEIRKNSEGRRLTYLELKQLTSVMLDHMLEQEIIAIVYNETGNIQIINFNDDITTSENIIIQSDINNGYDLYCVEHSDQPILSLTI